jgi:hypothetical protein
MECTSVIKPSPVKRVPLPEFTVATFAFVITPCGFPIASPLALQIE